jgi:hypothetical protein
MSRVATWTANVISGLGMSDPMSGYFMIKRQAFEGVVRRLSGQGFKILLDITTSSKEPLRLSEKPYQFCSLQFGESKLVFFVVVEYLMLLLDKLVGQFVPVRFIPRSRRRPRPRLSLDGVVCDLSDHRLELRGQSRRGHLDRNVVQLLCQQSFDLS